MKQIIRRLTALALCAILMMAMPLASAQELMTPEGGLLTVQIVITQPDGTMSLLPVTPVTNTMGNTVYWVDESMLSDDEIASLSTAQLQLVSETGELYAEMPLLESGFAGAIDERLDIVNDMIPGGALAVWLRTARADRAGTAGTAGAAGTTGAAGTARAAGTAGAAGAAGTTRAAGAAGTAGTARAAGAAGTTGAAERAGNPGVCDRGGRRRDVVQQRQHVGRGGHPERRRRADGHGLHDG